MKYILSWYISAIHTPMYTATAKPLSDRSGTMIRNLQAEESADHNRTGTLTSLDPHTYDSFRAHDDSAARKALRARNLAVRSVLLAQESDNDGEGEYDDYLHLQPAPPAVPNTSNTTTHDHIYEEPASFTNDTLQPSSTFL